MNLSNDLISQFVKITNDTTKKKNETVSTYGTVVEQDGMMYVQFDGSDYLTPVDTSYVLHVNDRVLVNIKNHQAVVSANLSSPSIGNAELNDSEGKVVDSIKDGYITGITTIGKNGIVVEHQDVRGYTQLYRNGYRLNDGKKDIISYDSEGLKINCDEIIIQNGIQMSSELDEKASVGVYEYDALSGVCDTTVYSYLENGIRRIGVDVDDVPEDIIRLNNVDLYQMVVMLWKAVQQLNDKLENKDVE